MIPAHPAYRGKKIMLEAVRLKSMLSENTAFILLLIIAALGLVPLWIVQYPPNVDLPNHLLAAMYHSGLAQSGCFGFLQSDWILSPFILFFMIFVPLTKFVGLITAAKIVLSFYIFALPAAFWCFLKESGAQPLFAFLLLPVIFSYHFEWGFMQYCIGIPITIAAIVCSFRILTNGLSVLRGILAVFLIVLAYLSHLDNFIVLSIAIAVRSCFILAASRHRFRRTLAIQVGRILVIFMPASILMLRFLFFLRSNPLYTSPETDMFEYSSLSYQIKGLLRPFLSIDYPFELTWLTIVAMFFGLGFACRRIRIHGRLELALAIVYGLIALIIPRYYFWGSWEHSSRFVVYAVICAFAAVKIIRPIPRSAIIIPAVLCYAAIVGNRVVHYREVDARINDIVSTLNQTVLPCSRIYTLYIAPYKVIPSALHAIGYYHLANGGVSPFLFTHHPPVNGFREVIPLQRYAENTTWHQVDPGKMAEVLRSYDYFLITTLGQPVPHWISRLPIRQIGFSNNCAVYAVLRSTN
jgi:hypothetical protein